MRTESRAVLLVVGCLMAILPLGLAGCGETGPATYPVSGRVVLPDGTPATHGIVEFRTTREDETVINAHGQIQSDGTFHVSTYGDNDGAVPGEHQVILVSPAVDDGAPATQPIFARKYRDYSTSGLSVRIEPGENNVVIELE
ncbi:MAG: hypothetical protein WD045_06900 [Pirellulaceae bacterium]